MSGYYDFRALETKWRKKWEDEGSFKVKTDPSKKKFYLLEMFPYPSGKLHMGHLRNYAIGDAIARKKRMEGFNVLHPIGWDSFGLPAENAAIANKTHPYKWTVGNIDEMRRQFESMGLSYDWEREVATSHPGYYKWTQWIFARMVDEGIAYRKKSFINWCTCCNTVLANEQVVNGGCWRCDSVVEQKERDGWFLKITDYAEDLLKGLDELKDGWPERVLTMQKNWIGKSRGAEVDFEIDSGGSIRVFTTRPDTLYGATFLALAPEHPLSRELTVGSELEKDVEAFIQEVVSQDTITRTSEGTEKKGVFTGRYAKNPLNGELIPIWIANFVLIEYGSGAIMSVPAHDQRDFEFARKYDIPVRQVICPEDEVQNVACNETDNEAMDEAYPGDGVMVNSGPFNGLHNRKDGIGRVIEHLKKNGIGEGTVNYRLRDWGISRQRYWGAPIPVVFCDKCGPVRVPDDQLPVILPTDIKFAESGKSPIATMDSFINTLCPKCGGDAKRETDTMDTFMCSSWYFNRYTSPRCETALADKQDVDYWAPVDQYVGGIEHAVLHLLYARFFTKFLKDIGAVSVSEPFARLLTQGMVVKDGAKMSKSKGNVVPLDTMCKKYGADATRLFILFAAPPERDLEWDDSGIEGASRFLNRLHRLVTGSLSLIKKGDTKNIAQLDKLPKELASIRRATHKTIVRVNNDFTRFQFNTVIAGVMELLNSVNAVKFDGSVESASVLREAVETMLKVLQPISPHVTGELWEMMGHATDLLDEPWPLEDKACLVEDEALIVVQVNGKLRGKITVPIDASKDAVKNAALDDSKVKKFIESKEIRKVIVVPGKLVNIVV
ncbi:Leucyl-tRNA synthetase [hydrothermal vent metagenome]|uniref:leucine--tRNA ligase n=1 Tax=hydrothermal vent metagenome TaxID=652676 RepID=A0A3B1C7F9_9ZZZZ